MMHIHHSAANHISQGQSRLGVTPLCEICSDFYTYMFCALLFETLAIVFTHYMLLSNVF
jgi:hypothetical protein